MKDLIRPLLCISVLLFSACHKPAADAVSVSPAASASPSLIPASSPSPAALSDNETPSPVPEEPQLTPIEGSTEKRGAYTIQESSFQWGEQMVYGRMYLPNDGNQTWPTVILSHGIGADISHIEGLGMMFAERGIAAYAFEFRGGSTTSSSTGSMLEMSVHTEREDLCNAIRHVLSSGISEGHNLFLLGLSQGGYVTAEAAVLKQDQIAGLLLLYPAFNINDLCEELYPDPSSIPETGVIFHQNVGRIYFEDALSEPIREDMANYLGPVLIIHGDQDRTVPISYSEEAVQLYPDAELLVIEGCDHGFFGDQRETAVNACTDFISRHSAS